MAYLIQFATVQIVKSYRQIQSSSRQCGIIGAKGEVYLTLEIVIIEEICCTPNRDGKESLQMSTLQK